MQTTTLLTALRLGSPALPIGGYSYSQGLESAIEHQWAADEAGVALWIEDMLHYPLGQFELPLLAKLISALNRADDATVARLHQLYFASRESAELRAETAQMGYSLLQMLIGLPEAKTHADFAKLQAIVDSTHPSQPCALPYAWGWAAHLLQLDVATATTAYAWAWLENQIMAAIKAVPLGQQAGQRLLSKLLQPLQHCCDEALRLPEEQWHNAAPAFALASCWHETQYSRLFRS